MMHFDLDRAAAITGARLDVPDGAPVADQIVGMIQDSRGVQRGNLYVALPGARVDGHTFVADAADRGAAAALVTRPVDAPLAQLIVADAVVAMGDLARAWRAELSARVVGITGSNGKTTVKTLLAAILQRRALTLATRGNYNNEIGVPLTLSALGPQHRYAVVEMGCGQPGDIEYLAGIARPDIAVVTNAGPAHLERLGSIEGVARTKGELFSALPPGGSAVLNRDDVFFEYWSGLCGDCHRVSFGEHPAADVRLTGDEAQWRVETPGGCFDLVLQLPGHHNRMNALTATAAALALDIELSTIAEGLAAVDSLSGRLAARELPGGWRLIDDSYNANPASLYAALQVLAEYPAPRWLVIGNMAELGRDSAKLHREIGQNARALGIERIFAVGELAALVADSFGSGGSSFVDHDELASTLEALLHPGVTCLVKGSRSAHMESVIERLIAPGGPAC
ncbi:MAG: UDP-N-acetylmuramoyl-tripeptide--D-alanyl-D-alanine ligase [Wenzhouxiangellaceae bacterium]|nr:UDP-N-acetylmuramoyl-tripeptide--D-alanyl-D-alanine ligase [Wenzhouxiangellaceae bacterium]